MSQPLVSIIVPAYNAEEYLPKTFDCILHQTVSDWELIVVDDGAKDQTPRICDEYASKDERIRCIHKQNGGVSAARNIGLDNVRGKYVTFVDADDYIAPHYLEVLTKSIGDVDINFFPMKAVGSESEIPASEKAFELMYNVYSLQEGYIEVVKKGLLHPPYCKLFRNEIISKNNLRFEREVAMGEDLLFNLSYLEFCRSIVVGENVIYYYIKGNSVLSKTIRKDYADLQLRFYRERESFCQRHNIDYTLSSNRFAILFEAFSSIARATNLSKMEKRDALDRISRSDLISEYLFEDKAHSLREYVFRFVLRFPFLNKLF